MNWLYDVDYLRERTLDDKQRRQKMAPYVLTRTCVQVCVPVWVSVLVIWEEDENIDVDTKEKVELSPKETYFQVF